MGSETRSGRPKALGLISGGLDSTLAARILTEQGIEVEGVHFSTGFCKVDHRRALGRPEDLERPARVRNEALRAGADLAVPVDVVDVAEEYLREVVLRPRHGYGSAMNPCIDCRIFMLRKAGELARERGAEIVFTGEVVGQRPMSQHHAALALIEEESGLRGSLLRPLSAAHLPPTEAEKAGRIDRSRLGAAHGRARRVQLELARRFGIEEFPTPSGGCCFLADRNFAARLRDLLAHREPRSIAREDLVLLKVGRHFRLAHDLKAIFGRDEVESRLLRREARGRSVCQVVDGRGSLGLVEGEPGPREMRELAALAVRYSSHRAAAEVPVRIGREGQEQRLSASAVREERIRELRIGWA